MKSDRVLTALYLGWALAVVGIVFAKGALSPDNLTHLATGAWLGATALALPLLRRLAARHSPRLVFVLACVVSAAVVEVCYMFTEPLHPSLLIKPSTGVGDALRSIAVDLALTLPAYVAIFLAIWALARRYAYRPIEFAVLMAAGQAIGDGIGYFSGHPAMLVFLPWQMINYHAMTLVPFLAVREGLESPARRRRPAMFVLPLIAIPVVYWFAGATIFTVGRALQWIP